MTWRKDKSGDRKPPRGGKPERETKPAEGAKSAREDGKTPRGFVRPEHIAPDPWRVPIVVEQISDTGVERSIVADAGQLAAIATTGGLRSVHAARATFTLQPIRDGQVQVTGRVTARIGQVCVVSLDDIDSDIDEEIDIIFAPPSKIPPMASTIDDSGDDGAAIPDPPEPIENGVIDIGRVATDALFLAVDPYPRKPGAVLALPAEPDDPEEHPFAALKALQGAPKTKPD
ncbi:MAG: phosphodiesterase [Tardiphaga sp.]|nr:phosphodiesterase [Tardiphaga sp.]MDB5630641.1 phosphodiesterase [Tardiphaga sp.]